MASGIETLRGIVVVKVLSLKFLRTSWEISSPSFVRESNLVRRMPSISSFGLSPLWTEAIVERSCAKASSAKYSHCLGIMTLSAAFSEFRDRKPRDGGGSMRIKSKASASLQSSFSFRRVVLDYPCFLSWLSNLAKERLAEIRKTLL